jgi:uroporphyrinogen-III synthase
MHVLVTRPEPQATRTAELLAERGHRTHAAPLAVIEPLEAELPAAVAVDAVLLTSANAVPALQAYLHLPVYTVGDATAAAARAAGAGQVVSADGDWVRLAALLRGPAGPPAGSRLLHLSGTVIAGDLAGAVRAAGFACDRRTVYTVRPATTLPPELLRLLAVGTLDAALFFSPLHARIWCRLVAKAAMEAELAGIRAVCLSEAVAQPLRELGWRSVEVAAAPTLPALIDCLEGPG